MSLLDAPVTVRIYNPEAPFGGVRITNPDGGVQQIEISGGPMGPAGPQGPAGPAGPGGGLTPPFTYAGKWRVKSDGTLQFWNPNQSLWHTLSIGGGAGLEFTVISPGEA